jgi:hypothetical protein
MDELNALAGALPGSRTRTPNALQGLIPVPAFDHVPVYNSTYRDWRTANRRGGDFLAFSDVKRVPLSPPATFIIT